MLVNKRALGDTVYSADEESTSRKIGYEEVGQNLPFHYPVNDRNKILYAVFRPPIISSLVQSNV